MPLRPDEIAEVVEIVKAEIADAMKNCKDEPAVEEPEEVELEEEEEEPDTVFRKFEE